MSKLIIDTSVLSKWFNQQNEQHVAEADLIMSLALDEKVELLCPELAKYELGNVLLCAKKLKPKEVESLLQLLSLLPITFVRENETLAQFSYELAYNLKITYYDAAFLALAKANQATLVTENIKHQGKGKSVAVQALKDFTSSQY